MISTSWIPRFTGLLFILPLFAYGFGNYFCTEFTPKDSPLASGLGLLLILLNSILVALLAGRMYFLFRSRNHRIASIYLICRLGEAVLLLAGPFVDQLSFWSYQVAMLLLGIGSLPLFFLIFRQQLVPRFLSGWAILGYGLLAIGAICELSGLPWGIVSALPGGLFELSFGLWLLFRKAPSVNSL